MVNAIASRQNNINATRLDSALANAARVTKPQKTDKETAPAVSKAEEFLNQKIADMKQHGLNAKGIIGDFDGDGKDDVLIINEKGLLQVYSQDETGEYSLTETKNLNFHGITDIGWEKQKQGDFTKALIIKRGDISVRLVRQPTETSENPVWQVDPNKYRVMAADINGDKIEDEVIVDLENNQAIVTLFDERGNGDSKVISIDKMRDFHMELVDVDGNGTLELRIMDNHSETQKNEKKGDTLYERKMHEFDEKVYDLMGDAGNLQSYRHKAILSYVKATGPHGSYSIQF
ncbi:MAG: hypothetical protein EYC62_03430 [Alphaproteobacteria bacterium]|nr:MAG: hypothetical protein EYC62_03430 [Alphaproteobacteria bacterium]